MVLPSSLSPSLSTTLLPLLHDWITVLWAGLGPRPLSLFLFLCLSLALSLSQARRPKRWLPCESTSSSSLRPYGCRTACADPTAAAAAAATGCSCGGFCCCCCYWLVLYGAFYVHLKRPECKTARSKSVLRPSERRRTGHSTFVSWPANVEPGVLRSSSSAPNVELRVLSSNCDYRNVERGVLRYCRGPPT